MGLIEGGIFTAEGPGPKEFVFKTWGLVGCVLEELILLRPHCQIVKSRCAFGAGSRRCFLQ